jgi:membrane protein implicated in regulation of membrane protease activity
VTRLQAVGVMLVALGLIYALLYAAWVRKRRQHESAAIAAERNRTTRDHSIEAPALKEKPAQVIVEGTYVSTTTAENRLERVTVEGLGNRARATLVVSRGDADELVRIDRQGEATVVIPAARLRSARRERGMVGKFVGANRLVVLQWRAENGDVYETGFLPRYKADVERVESALWWHTGETEPTEPTEPRTEPDAEPAGVDQTDPADTTEHQTDTTETDTTGKPTS